MGSAVSRAWRSTYNGPAMNDDGVVTKFSASVPVQVAGKVSDYEVELIHSEEGYSVGCPALPGCWSQGDSEQEALANIADAIKDYVEVAAELKRRRNSQLHKEMCIRDRSWREKLLSYTQTLKWDGKMLCRPGIRPVCALIEQALWEEDAPLRVRLAVGDGAWMLG